MRLMLTLCNPYIPYITVVTVFGPYDRRRSSYRLGRRRRPLSLFDMDSKRDKTMR